MKKKFISVLICSIMASLAVDAQHLSGVVSLSASVNADKARLMCDNNAATAWTISTDAFAAGMQWAMFTIDSPGNVCEIDLTANGMSATEMRRMLNIYVTYDPMNLGSPVEYSVTGGKTMKIKVTPKYGAHVKLEFGQSKTDKPFSIGEVAIFTSVMTDKNDRGQAHDKRYMDSTLPVEERVESLLSEMSVEDKMELIREGWGIPGIPHLYVPPIMKVEAVHGFSYGSGATIFPQALAVGATWDSTLAEQMAQMIGDETLVTGAKQAWSPVLDVAQDARWGRCEETFGEDPVLVSKMGGAWIKGYQSRGLMTTPKHFGGHGAPLGGRDSHDIGLSEREMREIHFVPFRNVIRDQHCQSLMMAYSDYMGVPVAKSTELLQRILRQEWGFDGFIVSDCGAIGNLTSRKHYTAKDKIEAANQALAAGIATNCGDTYNDKSVIEAAKEGLINIENLDNVCRTMLRTMFRNEIFETPVPEKLNWDSIYPGWNSDPHKAMARQVARESIVMLENKDSILPLSKRLKSIAVIGPGADDLQPGDYTPKLQPGQLKSVLSGIRAAVGAGTGVVYAKGCEFTGDEKIDIAGAVEVARNADVAVLVLGDCSTSESTNNVKKTSGENSDYATLILPGRQQELLEAVCAVGKPVILVLQAGRPYNLSEASKLCDAIIVNWLPGQEGGPATADVLFGDYNPAGRLPMTFPRHVGQLPLYYNFKTSGRRYEYSDMEYYPLYRFGYGLSYTSFEYSDLKVEEKENGNIKVQVTVTNVGEREGDEVVQLYVTDMYASVKTRVMELKGFDRIHLFPGEEKRVEFELTPYEISLLDENMDRVVESGEFKISVGGASPSYVAKDGIKNSVGYQDANRGLSTMLDYSRSFAADFELSIAKTEQKLGTSEKVVWLAVTNRGELTDTGKVEMYVDGNKTGDPVHYELNAKEAKTIPFTLSGDKHESVTFVSKYKMVELK